MAAGEEGSGFRMLLDFLKRLLGVGLQLPAIPTLT